MAIKVLQNLNADGLTIHIKEEQEGNKLFANAVFTGKTVTVDNPVKLMFRELMNHNKNKGMMICTGFYDGKDWYGDRPNVGVVKDVLADSKITVNSTGDKTGDVVEPDEINLTVNIQPEYYISYYIPLYEDKKYPEIPITINMKDVTYSEEWMKGILTEVQSKLFEAGVPVYTKNSTDESVEDSSWIDVFYPVNPNEYSDTNTTSYKEMHRLAKLIKDTIGITENTTVDFTFKPTSNAFVVNENQAEISSQSEDFEEKFERYIAILATVGTAINPIYLKDNWDSGNAYDRYIRERPHWIDPNTQITIDSNDYRNPDLQGQTLTFNFEPNSREQFIAKLDTFRQLLLNNNPSEDDANSITLRVQYTAGKSAGI